jgi:hypothetical protein
VNRHIGAVSERQQRLIEEYCQQPSKQLLLQEYGINQSALEILLWVKSMRSNADPGEAVGALAGQSIGEPSTFVVVVVVLLLWWCCFLLFVVVCFLSVSCLFLVCFLFVCSCCVCEGGSGQD